MEDNKCGMFIRKESNMKKVVYLLMCSSLLVIGGCTFNQRNHTLSQDNTKVSEKKTGTELMNENEGVGVIDFFNSTPKTILYGISGNDVNKNSEVKAVYVIEKGKMTVFNDNHPNGFNPDDNFNGEPKNYTSHDGEWIVPENEIFVSGDNRIGNNSYDSRSGLGTVPLYKIIGPVAFRILPLNKIRNFEYNQQY